MYNMLKESDIEEYYFNNWNTVSEIPSTYKNYKNIRRQYYLRDQITGGKRFADLVLEYDSFYLIVEIKKCQAVKCNSKDIHYDACKQVLLYKELLQKKTNKPIHVIVIASSKGNGYNDSIPFIRHNVQYRPIADSLNIKSEDVKSVQKCPNCGSILFRSGYMNRYGCRNYKRNPKCSWKHWDNKTIETPKHNESDNETLIKLIAWLFVIIFGLAIIVGSCSDKQTHNAIPVNVTDTISRVDTSFGSKVIKLLNIKYSEIKKNKADVWVGKRKDTGKWETIKSLNPKTKTKKRRREL